jgi:hypothetical protein
MTALGPKSLRIKLIASGIASTKYFLTRIPLPSDKEMLV